MEFIFAIAVCLLLAVWGAFSERKTRKQSARLQKKCRDLQLELSDVQLEIHALKLLKNDMETLRNDVDKLKVQRETEEKENAEERWKEQEAERLFTEGVNNILNFSYNTSGKREDGKRDA